MSKIKQVDPYQLGMMDYNKGQTMDQNPYDLDDRENWVQWNRGWWYRAFGEEFCYDRRKETLGD